MKFPLLTLAAVLVCTSACAQTLQQGQKAPATVVEQLKNVPLVTIGKQSVRAVPSRAPLQNRSAAGMPAQQNTTLVVRESDNLVGISAHELVVIGTDLEAMAAKVASLQLAGATTKSYPALEMLVVRTARFGQLEAVRSQVAAAFPDARFDLPVTYFPRKPR